MKEEALLILGIEEKTFINKQGRYQNITKSLIFLIVGTRTNITFSTFITSCFSKNLTYQYTEVVKTILHHLKNSRECSILYMRKKYLIFESYSDFD